MIKKLCKIISETYPYSFKDVEKIFEVTKSIDKTIIVLCVAQRFAVNPYDLAIDIFEK